MFKNSVLVGNILMIVGGRMTEGTGEKNSDKVYAKSLDPSVSVPSCLKSTLESPTCDFPRYFRAATSAIFKDGLPTVCGGWNENVYYKECYKFNYTDGWTYAGSKNFLSAFPGEDLLPLV